MSKRPYVTACVAVLVLALILLSLPDRTAVSVRLASASSFLPLFGLAETGRGVLTRVGHAVRPKSALLGELEELRKDNRRLRAEAMQGEEALRENARLRRIVAWRDQLPWSTRVARVIARDTADWWRTIRIDLGSRHGVRPDLPVMDLDGLVGRVREVGVTSSEVVLIGDPQCRVAVVIHGIGESGVISAVSSSVFDHRFVDLTHLPRHSALQPGQRIYTSGQGGVFPPGIVVGAIIDSRTVGYGLTTEARVRLASDTSRLREVVVLFP